MSDLYYLEYHDAAKNSHKFYAGNPRTGWVMYGRVGAKGTLKKYDYYKCIDMKYEKLKKGYNSAPTPQYVLDTLRDDGIVVSEGSKVVQVSKFKPSKVSANQGLLNWFGSLNKKE